MTAADLRDGAHRLGVRRGGVLMAHVSVGSFGWFVGGSGGILQALLDHLGPGGTLVAVTGWDDSTFHLNEWPDAVRSATESHLPHFDPSTSAAEPGMGEFAERLRTWPGAQRSPHPECSVAAVGARAGWVCNPHHLHDGFGVSSPLGRVVEAGGQVLLLGAPLGTVTMVHHAEAVAGIDPKRRHTHRMRVAGRSGPEWVVLDDIDTSAGAYAYEDVLPAGSDYVEAIATAGLDAGCGTTAMVGPATCHVLDAPALVRFTLGWLDERFAQPAEAVGAAEVRTAGGGVAGGSVGEAEVDLRQPAVTPGGSDAFEVSRSNGPRSGRRLARRRQRRQA